eukprot:TRINITY_DN12723_c0_g1_i5.p1 TRINITY_DN12723_c0_g1~~TRINITY_DN12723_c0_g1_i5.p1  ORF type:complete len:345 (+),score=69.55 TRINITY_DN12723_c0_g1_i5:39-1073(+)
MIPFWTAVAPAMRAVAAGAARRAARRARRWPSPLGPTRRTAPAGGGLRAMATHQVGVREWRLGGRPAPSFSPAELREDLSGGRRVTVSEVADEHRVSQAAVLDVAAELERTGDARIIEWQTQQVVTRSDDDFAAAALAAHTRAALSARREAAQLAADELLPEVQRLRQLDEAAEAAGERGAQRAARCAMVGMVVLWVVLFWMALGETLCGPQIATSARFAFDWTLVEPITFFMGYSVLWFGMAWYFASGREFSYDRARAVIKHRAASAHARKIDFDPQALRCAEQQLAGSPRQASGRHRSAAAQPFPLALADSRPRPPPQVSGVAVLSTGTDTTTARTRLSLSL